MMILEDARKGSSIPEKGYLQPQPMPNYNSVRTVSYDPYSDPKRAREMGADLPSFSPASNPNNKGIKVKTVPHVANGHGIGVSYSNVVFSYN